MNQSRISLLWLAVLYLWTSAAICAAYKLTSMEEENDEEPAIVTGVTAPDSSMETSSYDDTLQQLTTDEELTDGCGWRSRCYPGLPTNPLLVRPNPIGVIKGATGNYKLSFNVTPRGTVSDWSNILHFSNGNNCCDFGNRSPAIWFYPGTTQLLISVGDSKDGNWIPLPITLALPLNVPTLVSVEGIGINVTLTVGSTVYKYQQPTRRYSDSNVVVYAGSPWHAAANAEIDSLCYQILPKTYAGAESQLDEDDVGQ